jgi:hypothetical protein
MLFTRNKHKAIIGPDGNLYVIGGITIDNELVAEVERFNFTTSTWEIAGKLNVPRYGFGVCIYDNKIYIFGGALPGSNVTNSIEYYDGVSWKETPFVMPFTIGNFASVVQQDTVYIAQAGLRQLCAFSLKTGEPFEVPGLMDNIRFRHSMSAIGNKLYVIGGYNQDGEGVSDVECYDVTTNTWSNVGSLNTPRWFHTSVNYNNKIYVLGGKIANSVVLDSIEMVDGITCTVVDAKLPTPTALHSTVLVNNEVYVIQSGLRSVETFLLTNETPTIIPTQEVTQPEVITQPTSVLTPELHFINRDGFNILTDSLGNVYPIHGWKLGDLDASRGIKVVSYDPITKNVVLT